MRGYIRERPVGSMVWEVMVDTGRDPKTGKRRRATETVRGPKRLAQARLSKLLVEVDNQTYRKPSKYVTVKEYMDRWLENYVEVQCSPRTVESYAYIAKRHIAPQIGAVRLCDLTADHLQTLYRAKIAEGLSRRTVRYCHSVMSQMLTFAVKQDVLVRNVADAADPPRLGQSEKVTLAVEDVERFLEAAHTSPYYAVFYLLLHTGLRRGEALALRWRHIDLGLPGLGVEAYVTVAGALVRVNEQTTIKEPKTAASRRRVPLPPSCALVLRQHRQEQVRVWEGLGAHLSDDDFVFTKPEGGPLDPSTVSKAFAKVIHRAGLPAMPLHGLRHTHATVLLSAGTHPKIVQERLGHASIRETLDTYSHVVAGLQEAAAARFDEVVAGANVSKMSAFADAEVSKRG